MRPESKLEGVSDAIINAAANAERRRVDHEKRLGMPAVFIKDPDASGHGTGYFLTDKDTITCYRRYSHGYANFPCATYDRSLVKILHKIFKST